MGPCANHSPPDCSKSFVSIAVTLFVGDDFRAPELGVLLGPRRVPWAAVPEAAINEDSNA
jgi:hypothetical protein